MRPSGGESLRAENGLSEKREWGSARGPQCSPAVCSSRGTPHVEQVEQTVTGILNVLGRETSAHLPWLLAYQSQVGPIRWVGPTVEQALEAMLGDGLRSVQSLPL